MLSCETRLLIIDDLHFLHWQRSGGVEISNHFKYIANEFPVTLLSIGIGLGDRGLLMEDLCCNLIDAGYQDIVLEQTTRRTTMLEMLPVQHRDRTGTPPMAHAARHHRGASCSGFQTTWHARRRPVGLPVHAQHRTHRLADGTDPTRLRQRHPHRRRNVEPAKCSTPSRSTAPPRKPEKNWPSAFRTRRLTTQPTRQAHAV